MRNRQSEPMAQCDKTGLYLPVKDMMLQYDGLFVCKEAYTTRPVQETFTPPTAVRTPKNPRELKYRFTE